MPDRFEQQTGLTAPGLNAFDAYAAKSDSVDLAINTRAIYVGTAGDVKVNMVGGGTVTFKNVPAGSLLPIRVQRLWSTGTAVTDCIGLY